MDAAAALAAMERMMNQQAETTRQMQTSHAEALQLQRDANQAAMERIINEHATNTAAVTNALTALTGAMPAAAAPAPPAAAPVLMPQQTARFTPPPMPPSLDKDMLVNDGEPSAVKRIIQWRDIYAALYRR